MISVTWRRTQRLVPLAAGCCLFVFALYLGFHFPGGPTFNRPKSWGAFKFLSHTEPSSQPKNPACMAYPSLHSDVVIVVKTGATEALSRIPTQLLTFLSCAKDDVLIFSDMKQEIGGFHIYDALEDVVGEAKTVNSDFELYELQKQMKLFGEDVSSLSKAEEAWALDKYKNIHTAQKAWELRPNRTWYFFIDADTYVVWPSFFAWLSRLDPTRDIYLGNTIHTLNLFAHGGSGYLISRTGMLELAAGEDAPKIAADFDISASTTCCGDAELAGALSHNNVSLIDSYPLINDHKPRNMPFGPKYWCQPIITMHHMSPEEVNDLWQFEQSRENPKAPLLFEELSNHIVPKFSSQRPDWDNLSDEIIYRGGKKHNRKGEEMENEKGKFDPVDDCMQMCLKTTSCFQYLWDGESCKLSSNFFSLGSMKEAEEGKTMVSGWDLKKIKEFQRHNGQCGAGLWEYDK